MSKCKRKCPDDEAALGTAGSIVDPNNWLDPQYLNLNTLPPRRKRANFIVPIDSTRLTNTQFANIGTNRIMKIDFTLPECVGLSAVQNGSGSGCTLSGPTGKTKLKFPKIHDCTFRVVGYNPQATKIVKTPDGTGHFMLKIDHMEKGMFVALTDGRDIKTLVPDQDKFNPVTAMPGPRPYTAAVGLNENDNGVIETHCIAVHSNYDPGEFKSSSTADAIIIQQLVAENNKIRDEYDFSNITREGYQVLNDKMSLLIYDSRFNGLSKKSGGSTTVSEYPFNFEVHVQIDYDLSDVLLEKLLVYRETLSRYAPSSVKPKIQSVRWKGETTDTANLRILIARADVENLEMNKTITGAVK